MTGREKIFEYAKMQFDTEPQYLWKKYPNYAVLRHKNNNKWFAVIMNVEKEKLGLQGKKIIDIMDVKCYPEMIGSLRKEKGILPAYHMNKEHWITILLDGSIEMDNVFELLNLSYELTG